MEESDMFIHEDYRLIERKRERQIDRQIDRMNKNVAMQIQRQKDRQAYRLIEKKITLENVSNIFAIMARGIKKKI